MNLTNKTIFLKLTMACSALLLVFAISSCGKTEDENLTFTADILPVYNTYCKSCHETGQNYAPVILGYASVKDAAMNKGLLDRIQSETNPMPVGGKMPAEEIQKFIDWAADGYLE